MLTGERGGKAMRHMVEPEKAYTALPAELDDSATEEAWADHYAYKCELMRARLIFVCDLLERCTTKDQKVMWDITPTMDEMRQGLYPEDALSRRGEA